jgi:DHA1 family bicyclomycin/chloramphenicol resistance-like MFS transporter
VAKKFVTFSYLENLLKNQQTLSFGEFVALMAMMMALAALSTDVMLPALSNIGIDLAVQGPNATQLVVSFLFLGLSAGQILFGPLSDSVGRKPGIYLGYVVFAIGTLMSMLATSFNIMLAGRLLQGFGIAGPRSVTLALIRDQYKGREMARVMSFVMVVFILVPIIAPSFGQAILLFADWRAIFGALLIMAAITALWFALRQPETLVEEKRIPFSLQRIWDGFREVLAHRGALGYTLAAGLISGAFLGYINSAQQIFQDQYGLGEKFPLYFSFVALSLGSASFLNGRLVIRFGMRALSTWSVQLLTLISVAFALLGFLHAGDPSLLVLMIYFMTSFFCVGILFGNLNSLAMEPLGHIAGVGAAVVGSLSTFIATPLGIYIGLAYNNTVMPIVIGFAVLSVLTMLVIRWAQVPTQKKEALS